MMNWLNWFHQQLNFTFSRRLTFVEWFSNQSNWSMVRLIYGLILYTFRKLNYLILSLALTIEKYQIKIVGLFSSNASGWASVVILWKRRFEFVSIKQPTIVHHSEPVCFLVKFNFFFCFLLLLRSKLQFKPTFIFTLVFYTVAWARFWFE